ncbi:MAG: endolytic transglycosylase MltG [Chloroflexi bacterium]|nr:endolytic transglycosylase MltG [Chloroflexota bacterium]
MLGGIGSLPGLVRGGISQLDTPVSSDSRLVTFTVKPGQSAIDIGEALQQAGLIRSPITFRAAVEARGVGAKIESGDYQLSPSMTTAEIVAVLSKGASRTGILVTIPEGWRAEQAAQKAEAVGVGRADDVLTLVRAGAGAGLPLAEQPPSGASLEGYLFPDTYEVAKGATPRALVEMMAKQFDKSVTPALRQRLQNRGLSLHQGITLASIVEREAAIQAEQPVIASVYLNRLKRNMPLQADPTVQFAVASGNLAEAVGFGFWKRELTRDDLRNPSPYNTYVQRGLPPGPICSPGLAALEAVANAADTEYLFFVAKGDGSHVFAKTDTEHAANVERYQR